MPSGLTRLAGLFLLVSACLAALRLATAPPPVAGQFPQDLRPRPTPRDGERFPPNVVKQGFPAARYDPAEPEKSDTAWEIEWELTHPENRTWFPPGCVLRIKSARFMWKDRTGQARWMSVVRMLEIAEIYVPYDNGSTAFLDIHDMSFHMTPARKEFLGPNCVAPGEVLTSSNPAWSNIVHKEVHDDGVRWMTAETDFRTNRVADRARRGEKLLLWGTYYGANYRYMIEYGFTDDGVISCRVGPTGHNFFDRRKDQGDTHLHVGCWRMEMDLGDPKNNEVLLARRVFDERQERFAQVARPFNKNGAGEACEGSARWNPDEFTTLRVSSKGRKNAHGYPASYDVISHRYGSTHLLQREGGTLYSDSDMDFINQDFWVTRTEPGFTDYVNVPRYAREKRPLAGQPTTIWLSTPAIHVARTEDFDSANGTSSYGGAAITTWAGFQLKPRDLFDGTPLHAPRRR